MTDSPSHPDPAAELDTLLAESPDRAKARQATAFDRIVGGRPLVLYGAGGVGRTVLAAVRRHGVEPVCFADAALAATVHRLEGLDVLHPQDAIRRYGRQCAFVVTIFNYRFPNADAQQALRRGGCDRVLSFAPLAWKYPDDLLPNYALDLPHRLLERADAVRAAFRLLGDDASRREYVAQVRWRLFADFERLGPKRDEPAYFPTDLLALRDDEVFVDCGAYDGDTVRSFLARAGSRFREVVALEPDPANCARLREYIAALPEGIRRRVGIVEAASGESRGRVRFCANGLSSAGISAAGDVEVECVPLDDVLRETTPTYIKMDIEGAEPAALRGAAAALGRARPVLAVCLYHQQDHLWQIPLDVHARLGGYRYHIRRYEPECWEVVLYAIPDERANGGRRPPPS